MRLFWLALPLAAACGPQVALISNEELPPSQAVTQPVAPAVQMTATPISVHVAPVAGFGLTEQPANTAELAPAVTQPEPDAGTVEPVEPDAGSDEPVGTDAGAPEPAPVDAGTVVAADAGTVAPWDGGTNGLAVSAHLALGLPDNSSTGLNDRWLLVRPQYVVSYDSTRKTPRWSSWKLESSDFGSATRATTFRSDPLLPASVPQAKDSDYVGSGFDRGHLCPSADRTATDADNDATFFLTNVVPQTHTSNAGPWLDLEDEARTIANSGKRLIIIAGPIYGVTDQRIGTGVAVPLSMFKVAVVLEGAAAPSTVTNTTKVYAAIVPNASVLSGAWRTYQVTVDEVERQTGLDFLSDVAPALQATLEARIDP